MFHIDYSEAMKLTQKVTPHFWKAVGLNVVRDGYHPTTGKRIHFVESLPDSKWYDGESVSHAFVFSER